MSKIKTVLMIVLLVLISPVWATELTHQNLNASITIEGHIFDHIVIIVMENHGIFDICGGGQPCHGNSTSYIDSLANQYGIAYQYNSIITTSQPNYEGLFSGSTQGCNYSTGVCSVVNRVNLVDR